MTHPLGGAFERIGRAGEHLQEFDRRINHFRETQQNEIFSQFDWESAYIPPFGGIVSPVPHGMPTFSVGSDLTLPLIFSILVGEICYNLRSALDYLVYELAREDSGVPQNGTQFPIEDTREQFLRRYDFGRRTGVYLRGVNTTHIAAIERLQPYSGCDWTKGLRDISNPDKHRTLIATSADSVGYPRVGLSQSALSDLPGPIRRAHDATGREVYVQFALHLEIQFADGTLVPETLEKLKLKVTESVDNIKRPFSDMAGRG